MRKTKRRSPSFRSGRAAILLLQLNREALPAVAIAAAATALSTAAATTATTTTISAAASTTAAARAAGAGARLVNLDPTPLQVGVVES